MVLMYGEEKICKTTVFMNKRQRYRLVCEPYRQGSRELID